MKAKKMEQLEKSPEYQAITKKEWQAYLERQFNQFLFEMERLKVGVKIEAELINPTTKEVIFSKTITSSYYKPVRKRK